MRNLCESTAFPYHDDVTNRCDLTQANPGMFSFFSKKAPSSTTAVINQQRITVNAQETILQAALRQGIDFPYSCRVGGCATCKCKLTEGKVKELTQTAYILSDAELDQGYILACQSVPKTDVCIEVDMASQQAKRRVSGRVVAQERLTHDIVSLRVQLDESLPYRAGQYAQLSVDSLPGVSRSYSFATPVQLNAQVTFFVRKVPGGVFSSYINDTQVVGQGVTVEGPMGDFWLRASEAPMMMVAGGSGLAPVLALLQNALDEGVKRPVVLLFGARTQADLYALDTIKDIAKQWAGDFTFVPVLSEEPEGSAWQGKRGLVTACLADYLAVGAHAYLCGPPPMIDAVTDLLVQSGVSKDAIHADRFTTLHDVPTAA
jgi:NAD(P)H-flavin reductase/ferredoxin